MLPSGWKKYLLGDIATFRNGLNFTKSDAGEEIKMVGVADFKERSKLEKIDELESIKVASKVCDLDLLASGDLLFVRSNGNKGLIGRCLYFPHVNDRISFSGFTIRGRVATSVIEPEFASYLMRSKVVTDQILLGGSGTNISNLSQEILSKIEVKIPSLTEQRRIAKILFIWDQSIATMERLIANSRKQWHALIGITLRLPSANPNLDTPSDNGGFPASVQPGIPTLPSAPADWRRVRLGDHLHEVRRPVVLADDENYTLVTVKRSRGGVQQREVLLGSEVKTPSQFFVHTDDFLISKRQIVHGACGIVPQQLDGAVVSNEYAVLNSDGHIDLRFLRYLSETRYFQQTCFHSSIGVHVEKMIFKTERWLTFPFNIPSLVQQQRIVEILDTASREIESIAKQLAVLKQEKAALMGQLLTGKRRVHLSDSEKES